MPTTPARARKWIRSGKATPYWKKGLFCVRLNVEPSSRELQEVALGIDPGSKKEAFTLKSEAHTYISIQTDAVTQVKDKVEARRNLRRARRYRNTPYRKNRCNRSRGSLSPSTRARWGLKVRIAQWLWSICPVTCFVVEDVKAVTRKGRREWNVSFSPLEVGKHWFYEKLRCLGKLVTRQGFETHEDRASLGLSKSSRKLSDEFHAHCVDSWVLANHYVGGHTSIDNFDQLLISPLTFYRRQLHVMNFAKGGVRKQYGSTRSLSFKRGSLVTHPKFGLALVGGTSKGKISLHDRRTNQRLTQAVKEQDIQVKSYYPWTYMQVQNKDLYPTTAECNLLPRLKAGVSRAMRLI